MVYVAVVVTVVVFLLLVVGLFIFYASTRSKYFGFEDHKTKFFMKKHAIFRFVALFFIVLHYFLLDFAVIFTLITVYMIMDEGMSRQEQIFFLVMAAIFSTLSNTIKLNEIANVYFRAMRKLETAILKYREEQDIALLIEANQEAEALIEEKFV